MLAQNPGLNPQLLGKAIEKYLPQCQPDFIRIRRQRILDANGEDFRKKPAFCKKILAIGASM